jgi:hypothetical protein
MNIYYYFLLLSLLLLFFLLLIDVTPSSTSDKGVDHSHGSGGGVGDGSGGNGNNNLIGSSVNGNGQAAFLQGEGFLNTLSSLNPSDRIRELIGSGMKL